MAKKNPDCTKVEINTQPYRTWGEAYIVTKKGYAALKKKEPGIFSWMGEDAHKEEHIGGFCAFSDGAFFIVLNVANWDNTIATDMENIGHEVEHAMNFLCKKTGVKREHFNDEPTAYLQGAIIGQLTVAYLKARFGDLLQDLKPKKK